jgi:arylsulfatase
MHDMLPYYAGVYAYDVPALHPNFPKNDPEFMSMWSKVNLAEWEGRAGEKPHVIKEHFNYDDLATADDDMRAKAVDYIRGHAEGEKPFFMLVCFEKVHNPNNPSPRWKGKSPGGGNYLDALMEMDDNSGQILQAVRDAGIPEDTLVIWTTDNGAWIDAWPDAGYTPFRGEKGSVYEGGLPRTRSGLVARPHQTGLGEYGYVEPHGLVADHRLHHRRIRAPARVERQQQQTNYF